METFSLEQAWPRTRLATDLAFDFRDVVRARELDLVVILECACDLDRSGRRRPRDRDDVLLGLELVARADRQSVRGLECAKRLLRSAARLESQDDLVGRDHAH